MPGGPVSAGGGIGASGSKNKLAGIAMTAFAAFGGILYGYDTGVINGLLAMNTWLCTFGTQGLSLLPPLVLFKELTSVP